MFDIVKPDLRVYTRLLSVAAAARRSPLMLPEARRCCWLRRTLAPPLLLHAAPPLRCCCYTLICCSAAPLLLLAKLQQHLGACQCCSLLGFSPRLRPGRKMKDDSRSVTCSTSCLGCVSMCQWSGLVPRASQCLEGRWVKMRPGAAVMAHPRRRMAVVCHLPWAHRCTSCCAVTGASSAALRGGEMFRLLAFFLRTLSCSANLHCMRVAGNTLEESCCRRCCRCCAKHRLRRRWRTGARTQRLAQNMGRTIVGNGDVG